LAAAVRLSLTLLLSLPTFAQPTEVVAGRDLEAWRTIDHAHQSELDAIGAYRAFIESWPTSALSEVAWSRLVELDDVDWQPTAPEARAAMPGLQRSLNHHQAVLERTPSAVAIASINADGTDAVEAPPMWHAAVVGGAGWHGGPAMGVGIRGGHGAVSAALRGTAGPAFIGELDVRLAPPFFGPGFLEAGIDTLGGLNTRAGGAFALGNRFSIEGSAGALVNDGISPIVRLDVAYDL
jgi:hypothetical protein